MIETERLYLREMTDGDFEALRRVLGDGDIMRHYPYAFDDERIRNWIARNRERYQIFGFGLWAVCRKDTGEMIGDCGLTMQIIDGQIRPEIGYHIRADHQRQGFAREAARAVRDWAFTNRDFDRLYSYMTEGNIASWSTAASAGLKRLKSYHDPIDGTLLVYTISREEWMNI